MVAYPSFDCIGSHVTLAVNEVVAPCVLGQGSSESQVKEIPVILPLLSVIADFELAGTTPSVKIVVCSPPAL